MEMFLSKFNAICEAYEVLSNQQLRTIYEAYGEEGLRRGIAGPDGIFRGGYKYQGNCYEIFEAFFLQHNPFSDLCTDLTDIRGTGLEIEGSYFGTAFRGMNEPLPEKESDITVTVDLTLEELYNGSRKTVTYSKKYLGLDGRTEELKPASVEIFVKPGMSETKVLTLQGKGHESAKHPTTDVIVKFRLVPSAKGSNASLYSRV